MIPEMHVYALALEEFAEHVCRCVKCGNVVTNSWCAHGEKLRAVMKEKREAYEAARERPTVVDPKA